MRKEGRGAYVVTLDHLDAARDVEREQPLPTRRMIGSEPHLNTQYFPTDLWSIRRHLSPILIDQLRWFLAATYCDITVTVALAPHETVSAVDLEDFLRTSCVNLACCVRAIGKVRTIRIPIRCSENSGAVAEFPPRQPR